MVKQVDPVFTLLQLPLADAQDAQTMSVYNLRNATGCGILTRNPNLPVPIIERTWLVRDIGYIANAVFFAYLALPFYLFWKLSSPSAYLPSFFLPALLPSLPP